MSLTANMRSKMSRRVKGFLQGGPETKMYTSLLLQGRMASWRVRDLHQIQSLQDVEFKVFSQWGEDGIIDWLIERACIPSSLHTFVEFGVETYREANTRFLMENRNWRGLIMDGSQGSLDYLKSDPLFWQYNLATKASFITRENINGLISEAGFSGNIGLLSIDLDGVDYWIWDAIEVIKPIICICEYNAIFGDMFPISVPYSSDFVASSKHYSCLYAGASISALRYLADKKGYTFLGTTQAANDAFFVRNDYAHHFDKSPSNITALPSKSRGSRNEKGKLSFVGGIERYDSISHLSVIRVDTGESVMLADLKPIYSEDWLSRM